MKCETKLQNHRSIDGNAVESVDNFVYLGSVFTSDSYCRPDINRRIGRASSVMSSLQHIWKNQRLSFTTKTRIYLALAQSVLLYAAKTWSLLSTDSRAFEAFHMTCQRQLLQIKWHQFIRDENISATTGLPSISDTISHRLNALIVLTAFTCTCFLFCIANVLFSYSATQPQVWTQCSVFSVIFSHTARLPDDVPVRTRHSTVTSTYRSVDHQTATELRSSEVLDINICSASSLLVGM